MRSKSTESKAYKISFNNLLETRAIISHCNVTITLGGPKKKAKREAKFFADFLSDNAPFLL